MKPGAVLVDISIDQGGCFEDSRPTTHANPTYRVHDTLFYCVANMPGAVPHTSTYALTNVTLPYTVEIANRGWRDALRADPARDVPPPTPPRRLPKAITLAEVERLLDTSGPGPDDLSADPRLLRDRALLEFLYGTGARISEATGLDVDELHLDADPVVRLAGKGGKQRVVPVGSYAVRALQAYLVRARPALAAASRRVWVSPAVFLNARGGRLTRQGAWGVLHAAAGRARLPDVSPHTLRHSFATHMLDGGADIRVVQELLGHASVATTQVYTLITVDRLREVYASSHPRALA